MSGKPECPSSSALESLVQGRLVEPQLSELSVHLETCPACLAQARTLSGHDTMIESLRGEAAGPDRIAREVPQPLVERLKQLPRRAARALTEPCADRAEEQPFDFLAPPQGPEEIGRLGHYRILKLLGSGGMGAVFLADDPKLERRVALKVMLPKVAARPAARERFLREARAQALVKNDHVVTIHAVDEADGVPYLTMELLEGQSLDEVLRAGGPLSVAQIIAVARDVARGLAAAHEKGLVHRDIKPANLWVEGEPGRVSAGSGRVKILDFGLAHADTEDVRLTQSGAVVGTPAYMAPEQAYGDRAADGRADLFSLGCVLYRLCTGDVPFRAETTMGTLLSVATVSPINPCLLNKTLPPALAEFILQLLQKDPARRPQSAREVLARLTEIEHTLARGADTAPALPRLPRRRRPLVFAGAGLLIAGLLATIVFWPTTDGRKESPALPAPTVDAERKAAEWARSLRATVEIRVDDRTEHRGPEVELPAGKFNLLGIDLERARVSDAELAHLEGLPNLVWLHLGRTGVSDAGMTHLKGLAKLLWLSLSDTRVSDAGLAHLKGLTKLEHLRLARTRVGAAGLAHLAGLGNLKLLDLWGTPVGDAGLAHLAGLTRLTFLDLTDTSVSDAGLVHVKGLTGLTVLSLNGARRVSDAGLVHVKGLTNLTFLGLDDTRVRDGLAHLNGLTELTNLCLMGTEVNDAGLAHLGNLKKLKVVNLTRTGVSAAAARKLHAAVPGCKIEHPGGSLEPRP